MKVSLCGSGARTHTSFVRMIFMLNLKKTYSPKFIINKVSDTPESIRLWSKSLPLHLTPLPLYPVLQVQVKPPVVSLQSALLSQLCLSYVSSPCISHSFMLSHSPIRPVPLNPEEVNVLWSFCCNYQKLLVVVAVDGPGVAFWLAQCSTTHTNGCSFCVRSFCVLKHGDVQECHTGTGFMRTLSQSITSTSASAALIPPPPPTHTHFGR